MSGITVQARPLCISLESSYLDYRIPLDRLNTINLARYNASKDWNKWYHLPGLDKISSLRSNGWRENALYIRDLTRPRIHGSVESENTRQSESSAAKVHHVFVLVSKKSFSQSQCVRYMSHFVIEILWALENVITFPYMVLQNMGKKLEFF